MNKKAYYAQSLLIVGIILLAAALVMAAVLIINETSGSGGEFDLADGVVIDPGHGGADPGAIAPNTGALESDMNLRMAQALVDQLNARGIPTKMTRAGYGAIGDTKEEDMAQRRTLINGSGCAALVSIHMNAFPDDSSVWGPQVFYQEGSRVSKAFASRIQEQMNEITSGTRQISSDSLYVLSAAPMPAVLVECGFITNPDEELLLQSSDYHKTLATAIADGICDYFDWEWE